MKKRIALLLAIFIFCMMPINAFAYSTEYSGGPSNLAYNRTAARDYLNQYTRTPNANYTDFSGYGGDCTNFVSQMLRAGGMTMTPKKNNPADDSWYYYGAAWGNRTSSWTAADNFRTYWGAINGVGYKHATAMYKYTAAELQNNSAAYKNLVSRCQIGDVIQFVNTSGTTYHSMGVQRVYYSDGVRKVTISQHTSNDFYHLTDKIANKTTGWVVLLKMANYSVLENASLNSINTVLNDNCAEEITSADNDHRNCAVESLSTEQLEILFERLQNVNCETSEKDEERWALVESIGDILNSRYEVLAKACGDDVIPKTVVTRDVLIRFIQDYIDMCKAGAEIPISSDLNQKTALVYVEGENAFANEALHRLQSFLKEVEANANDQNAYTYWTAYWTEIRGENMPTGYCEG